MLGNCYIFQIFPITFTWKTLAGPHYFTNGIFLAHKIAYPRNFFVFEVCVSTQESARSCIYVRGIDFVSVSKIYFLDI